VKFLLELASEEIPARMQAAAAEQLRTRFVDGLKAAGLAHGEVVADATPRRLWLISDDVAVASAASVEERKGPAATAPEAAIAGFLRSTGLTREQLEERQTPKGVVLFAQIASPGRDAAAILVELVPAIVRDFQWPKSMRWGQASVSTASPRWVRPLTGIVAMLDGDVVPCEVHGIAAGKTTRGHRVHAPLPIEIEGPETYAAQLRAAKVVVSSVERRGFVMEKAAIAAAARGLSVVPDAGLVAENAGLTEWPVPMLGAFDPAFLAVPREVIQLTMRTNQKYFAVVDGSGALAPGFVCVANLEASDGGKAIVAGNERVLSARLSDAKFFWDQDVATVTAGGLEAFLPKLSDIVFHEKLRTVADKVERVAKLARWLVESGAVAGDADLAEQAARLCKADLVSATVGEFPEMQGIAGAYLARVAGLDAQVADAIRDHYKPVGQGDDVPTAPVSVAVALADKLDTLVGFFAIGELPTGSRDPFALRRAALGVLSILIENQLRLEIDKAALQYQPATALTAMMGLLPFLVDRLTVQQREAGTRHDVISAAYASAAGGDFVLLLKRVRALQDFMSTDDGVNLLAGYKRAANILKIEAAKGGDVAPGSADVNPAEVALGSALDAALPAAAAAVAAEDFARAMAALAGLRGPVDAFFADVMVNDRDPETRARRLALLARFRDAVHEVADFSRIEG
jgi:glycyl-tRNA synthetase beta chain